MSRFRIRRSSARLLGIMLNDLSTGIKCTFRFKRLQLEYFIFHLITQRENCFMWRKTDVRSNFNSFLDVNVFELRLPLIGIYSKLLQSSDFLTLLFLRALYLSREPIANCIGIYNRSTLVLFISHQRYGEERLLFLPLGCEKRVMKFSAQEFPVVWCQKVKSQPIRLLETL